MDLDRVCFLRVHKPAFYGDKINRFTLSLAMREIASTSGVELGPFGTLTLRVVHPWWIDGELNGYVEIGVEMERLVPKLKNILDSELIFTVDKSFLDRSKWEEGLKIVGRRGDWDQFPDFVAVSQTLEEISSNLNEHVQFHASQDKEHIIHMSTGNRKYRIGFVPLIDIGGRNLGDIIVLKDITEKEAVLHIQLLTMITASAVVGVLMFGFFYLYVGRIESRLLSSHNALKDEIEERKQVEKALQQSRDGLEIRVQERTADLKKAMSNCKLELKERMRAEEEIRRLSQRLFSVIEEERKKLARDLHDEFGQALTMLHFSIEALQNSLPDELEDHKKKCDELIRIAEQQCENISDIVSELRPDTLDHLGFIPTLEWYIEDFVKQRDGLNIDFRAIGVKKRPDPEIEIILYRILQESLTNVAKHAKAKHVSVTLTNSHPNLIFVIKDDGVGFDPAGAFPQLRGKKHGVGLIGMRERVTAVEGQIEIRSMGGKGTVIRVELPARRRKVEV